MTPPVLQLEAQPAAGLVRGTIPDAADQSDAVIENVLTRIQAYIHRFVATELPCPAATPDPSELFTLQITYSPSLLDCLEQLSRLAETQPPSAPPVTGVLATVERSDQWFRLKVSSEFQELPAQTRAQLLLDWHREMYVLRY